MDGVAYTCAGVQIRDAYDAAVIGGNNMDESPYEMRVYRAAIGYMVECHGSKEATPSQIGGQDPLAEPTLECTRTEETKGCRTKVFTLTDVASNETRNEIIKANKNAIQAAVKEREQLGNFMEAYRW